MNDDDDFPSEEFSTLMHELEETTPAIKKGDVIKINSKHYVVYSIIKSVSLDSENFSPTGRLSFDVLFTELNPSEPNGDLN